MVHVGANKFGIDVHTRMLLKLHFSHFSCNMFVGQWAHIVYLSHPPTLLWVPLVILGHLSLHSGAVFLLPFILPLQMEVCLRFWRQQFGVPAEAAYPPPQNPPARRPDPSRKRCHAGVLLGAHIHTVALTIGKHLATNL